MLPESAGLLIDKQTREAQAIVCTWEAVFAGAVNARVFACCRVMSGCTARLICVCTVHVYVCVYIYIYIEACICPPDKWVASGSGTKRPHHELKTVRGATFRNVSECGFPNKLWKPKPLCWNMWPACGVALNSESQTGDGTEMLSRNRCRFVKGSAAR